MGTTAYRGRPRHEAYRASCDQVHCERELGRPFDRKPLHGSFSPSATSVIPSGCTNLKLLASKCWFATP